MSTDMPGADVLALTHSSKLAGAELCLADIVRGFGPASRVFLFEDGPLHELLRDRNISVTISQRGSSFAMIKKDRSLVNALPQVGKLAQLVLEIAVHARRHQVIYASSQKAFVLAALAALMTRRPLVWHLHDILSPSHFGKHQRRLTVILANLLTTCVVVPSQASATAFIEAGGKKSLLYVIANGLDVPPETMSADQLRAELGLPSGFLFGVFSRISPWKGQHVAIEALARVPSAQCIIAGAPLFGEDAYATQLRATARRLEVTERVTFLGHRTDVVRLMRAVDVVVHPSVEAEPFGRTIVEAMLCRVPVIAANNGAAPEILDDGRVGFLVPPGDVQGLAGALQAIMANGATTVDRAEQRAKAVYNSASMATQIQHVLTRIVNGGDMVSTISHEMKASWDLRAKKDAYHYVETHFWQHDRVAFFAMGEERAAQLIDPMLTSFQIDGRGKTALDVGCAVGRFTQALGRRFDHVVGIDVSDAMVSQATEAATGLTNLTFISSDGVSIPQANNSVDFVWSYEVFQHMPSHEVIRANLREIARVLSHDGYGLLHFRCAHDYPAVLWHIARWLPTPFIRTAKGMLGKDALTADRSFIGAKPLEKIEIPEICKACNLDLVEFRDDPTHQAGTRLFAVVRVAQ